MNVLSSVGMTPISSPASLWRPAFRCPGITLLDVRQNGSQPKPSRFWAALVLPPTPDGGHASEAVQAVFRRFDHQGQRRRSILRLLLVGVIVLAVFAGTPRHTWAVQFAIVGVYAVFAVGSAFLNLGPHPRPSRTRTATMMGVDIAAICLLQLPSTGSYLMLGLLAFLPFFIATQSGRLSAVMSVAAIIGGGLVIVTDTVLRHDMSGLQTMTVLVMLALLCVCSYAISAIQQRRMQSFAELIASRSLLLADVMSAEDRERRHVAEALHDGALQTLLAVRQDLRAAVGPRADLRGLPRAVDLLDDVSRELRALTKELHPSVLDAAGLQAAIRGLLDTLVERTGVAAECDIDYPRPHAEDPMIYGIARELLTNVTRHAEAKTVWLTLRDEGDVATLDVHDDGVGIDPAVFSTRIREGHIGLASQRSRVETARGTWEFRPVEQGTWVRVTLPLHDGREVR